MLIAPKWLKLWTSDLAGVLATVLTWPLKIFFIIFERNCVHLLRNIADKHKMLSNLCSQNKLISKHCSLAF